jgi:hypothetical protein
LGLWWAERRCHRSITFVAESGSLGGPLMMHYSAPKQNELRPVSIVHRRRAEGSTLG